MILVRNSRDMVREFQSNREYFVFLLSTRAGGLGINLTSVRWRYVHVPCALALNGASLGLKLCCSDSCLSPV